MTKNPRLQFTKEEREAPELKKPIRKADKAAARADKAREMIPKKKQKVKERTVDPATGKQTVRLRFEETDKSAPPAKLTHAATSAPGRALLAQAHRRVREAEVENVGVEGAHKLEECGEQGIRTLRAARRYQKRKPYRAATRAEGRLEKANVDALYQKALHSDPQLGSNPVSRWQQKRAIKKQYAAAKRAGHTTGKAAQNTAKAAKQAAREGQRAANFISRHKKEFGIAIGIFLVLCLLLNTMSSCSVLFQSVLSGVAGTTYPSSGEDMTAVEQNYLAMELALQGQIDNMESERPGYDEYRYDIGKIEHNPHELAAYLSAVFHGYTLPAVTGELERLFGKQYTLTLTEKVEVRYRTETTTTTDPVTGKTTTTTERVPYDYRILNVTLESKPMGAFAEGLLDAGQLELYRAYLTTSGQPPPHLRRRHGGRRPLPGLERRPLCGR